MAAPLAYLLKEGFRPTMGLDRNYAVELWHVTGITGWTPQNTADTVYAYLPYQKGSAYPDPSLSSAICTAITLADGPFVNLATGSMDAVVAVTFDSGRRWGAASYFQGGMTGRDLQIQIPSFALLTNGTVDVYTRNDFSYVRSAITRVENRIATGITESQKFDVFNFVGRVFDVYGIPYYLRSPQIIKLPTNATLLRYIFESYSPIRSFPSFAGGSGNSRAVDIPQLGYLEEYQVDNSTMPPTIRVVSVDDIDPDVLNPADLPFWTHYA